MATNKNGTIQEIKTLDFSKLGSFTEISIVDDKDNQSDSRTTYLRSLSAREGARAEGARMRSQSMVQLPSSARGGTRTTPYRPRRKSTGSPLSSPRVEELRSSDPLIFENSLKEGLALLNQPKRRRSSSGNSPLSPRAVVAASSSSSAGSLADKNPKPKSKSKHKGRRRSKSSNSLK